MRLEKASTKAVRYAIMNYHYSKSIPMVQSAFSVFNGKNEWCGVVCYAIGANNNIAKPYNLTQGQVCELVRVALNGKQESTSKAVGISLRLLAKSNPFIKLVVSYADTEQGHKGIIYQASNWFFEKVITDGMDKVIFKGKITHKKTVNSIRGTTVGLEVVKAKPKYKYIYPLDKSLIPMCKALSKPYPKKEITCDNSITANAAAVQVAEEGQHHLIAQKS